MATKTIPEGSLVRVFGGTKPGRPGIVLRHLVRGERLLLFVPWGTGTFRPDRKKLVVVEPDSPVGHVLGLDKTTYFYAGNVTVCSLDDARLVSAECPPYFRIEIQELYGA